MLRRFDWSDRSAIAAVVFGVLAAYLPWYGYSFGAAHVAVNGFRASLLGDAFFLLIAVEALLVLMRHGIVADLLAGRISERTALTAIAVLAGAALLLQTVMVTAGGRNAGPGMVLAFFAVVALGLAAAMRGYDAEPRRTVRDMLGEELPD